MSCAERTLTERGKKIHPLIEKVPKEKHAIKHANKKETIHSPSGEEEEIEF
jgi:hypothetical protein